MPAAFGYLQYIMQVAAKMKVSSLALDITGTKTLLEVNPPNEYGQAMMRPIRMFWREQVRSSIGCLVLLVTRATLA